ncbi:MAG: phosphate ABC transporter substrate-binding protein [Acidobacteria bacterium]|nr:phosphate ABC transporter substrate-binding protein [Acidobacteriota bacterium]
MEVTKSSQENGASEPASATTENSSAGLTRKQMALAAAALLLVLAICAGVFLSMRKSSTDNPDSSAAKGATSDQFAARWVGCDISKASFMDAVTTAFKAKTGRSISVEEGGATRGIRDVVAGKADMGGSCRHALDIPEERGVKFIPVAWDALVVIVHPSNSVSSIPSEKLRDVLTGKITNWKQLGGANAPIQIYDRKGKLSGVGAGTRLLLFGNPDQELATTAKLFDSTRPLEEGIEQNPNAIAITGISSARLRQVKILNLDGKSASHDNIIKGQYLLYRPLYLTVPEEPNETVSAFISYLLSPEGQEIVKGTGTVNLAEGKDLWEKFKTQMQTTKELCK